jgi:hypothetical protein
VPERLEKLRMEKIDESIGHLMMHEQFAQHDCACVRRCARTASTTVRLTQPDEEIHIGLKLSIVVGFEVI